MTEPAPRPDQIWERKAGRRRVRVLYVDNSGPALHVGLINLGHGRKSACKASTLHRDYRIISAPPIGDWP